VVTVRDAVREYLKHLVVERGLAANTIESYRRDLRRYADVLAQRGKTALADVRPADVSGFLASLRQGDEVHQPLAAGSAGRAVVAVRGMHAFACAQGMAPDDPAREVAPPAPPRRLPKAITLAEVERLLDAAGSVTGDDPRALRDRALLEFLYGTGARISEAVGLDTGDLDLAADPAVRLAGKGGKERIVPVGSYAVRALQAYLVRARPSLAAAGERAGRGARTGARRASASPAVFRNARGGRLTRQGAWGVLHAAAGRAGVAGVSPHTLRHSFATHMLDGGADIRVVQELLGHASVTTTQVYTLVTVEKLREVYAASHPRALG
jgi:integrase/recombinase XerD